MAGERRINRKPKSYVPFHHKHQKNVIHSPVPVALFPPRSLVTPDGRPGIHTYLGILQACLTSIELTSQENVLHGHV
jgi:hypothetical protein